MASREQYNACMRPFITGSKPKDQRKRDFCVGAKICSGKAETQEEALELCARSIPKWAQKAAPKEVEELSCAVRMGRVQETIDTIALGLKTGEVDEMLPASAQMLTDITHCGTPEIIELASLVAGDLKDLSGRPYLKGEAKEIQNRLDALKGLL